MYMATSIGNEASGTPRTLGGGYLFGVPVGDLGIFATLLMGAATGFIAFFATTFCSIVGIALHNGITHRPADFALSYHIAFPVGLAAGAIALAYLGSLWIKRKLR
jgi:hypothetical protein